MMFMDSLEEIIKKRWDIEEFWQIGQQADLLNQYLQANWLLLACLEVAYVPDRQAIVDQLLLPPG
jgi:hypothetical protein